MKNKRADQIKPVRVGIDLSPNEHSVLSEFIEKENAKNGNSVMRPRLSVRRVLYDLFRESFDEKFTNKVA